MTCIECGKFQLAKVDSPDYALAICGACGAVVGLTTKGEPRELTHDERREIAHDRETMADLRLCHRGAHFASLKRQTAGG